MLAWMLRIAAMTLLAGMGAWCVERALRHGRRPARWVWLSAIVGVIALASLSRLHPGAPLDVVPGAVFDAVLQPVSAQHSVAGGAAATRAERLMPWLWLAGSALALFVYLAGWSRVRRLRQDCRPGVLCGRPVLISAHAGPAAVGLVRPAIVVPAWLLLASERVRRLVLMHEAEHVRAGDPWLLAISPLAAIAMPWNLPLWWMLRSLRLAIELDCDQRVLARGVPAETYGRVLIDVAGRRGPALSLALASRSKLARRLAWLTDQGSALRAGSWALAAALSFLLAAEALPAGSATRVPGQGAPLLAALDPAADYRIDGTPATYERVLALEPGQIRSIEVVARRTVDGDPAQTRDQSTVRVTTHDAVEPAPPTGVSFEGVGGPDPRIRLSDEMTFAARDVRLLLDGTEIDVERLGTVDPSRIHGVKVIRWSASARPEIHFTTRQRI